MYKLCLLIYAYIHSLVVCLHSGRFVEYRDRSKRYPQHFFPPKAIAQSAALASCLSRFRYTSRYIAHIDDDEFFFLSKVVRESIQETKKPLVVYTDRMFAEHPLAPALYFRVNMYVLPVHCTIIHMYSMHFYIYVTYIHTCV